MTEGTVLADRAELTLELERLRERVSRLSQTGVRTNASLDLGPVLREVGENVRTLTGAYCSAIVTIPEDGTPEDFVGARGSRRPELGGWSDPTRFLERVG